MGDLFSCDLLFIGELFSTGVGLIELGFFLVSFCLLFSLKGVFSSVLKILTFSTLTSTLKALISGFEDSFLTSFYS